MNSDARSRLAAQAAAAGYPPDLLALIANAALPAYQPGQQLEDAQIDQVSDAVEVLAQAGYTGADLPGQLADYQRRHGNTGASDSGAARCGSRTSATATRTATGSRPARPTPTGSPRTHARRPGRRQRREPPESQSSRIERRAR